MIADLRPYAEYKDSGVPWLGDVPAHWKVMAARQIGSISKGSGGSKLDTTASGVSCVRYGELYSKFDRMIRRPWGFVSAEVARGYTPIRYGDVLFAASGEKLDEIGKSAVNLMTEPAVCGGDVIILRPAQSLAHAFAGYAFENPIACAQKSSFGRGTTIKHLYPSELRTLMVALPPLPEQAAIVRFLDWATRRVDRAIRAKRRLVALLTEQKQAIVHRAVTQGLDPSVPMKASGIPWLGEIPAHWDIRRIKTLSPVKRGASPRPIADPRYFTSHGEYAWVRIKDVTASKRYLLSTTQRLSPLGVQYSVCLKPGSLFLSIAGSVGKAIISKILCCIHDGFVHFPNLNSDPEYLYYLLSLSVIYSGLGKFGTQLNLNTDTVGAIAVPWPALKD